jgi:hypothetical protein
MAGDDSSSKKVTVAVAVIGAIATLGAALFSNWPKPKEQSSPPPAIQQTSSGAGAINVGRDAVINNIKSASEEAAERVQACEMQHGLKTASTRTESSETIPARSGEPEQFVEHIDFRSCAWPKSQYADGDGYLEIRVRTVRGPGEYEATGTTSADRITAPCQQLIVAYQMGTQGAYENEAPFTINADTVVTEEDGKLWKDDGALPFYPGAGEFVVLHNSHHGLGSAKCK